VPVLDSKWAGDGLAGKLAEHESGDMQAEDGRERSEHGQYAHAEVVERA
jgi:hypothetical protein